jgi:cytosine/adenosine deaminase-related metal-dependent hydrolase
METTIIHAGAVLTPGGLEKGWGVRVEGNRIAAVGSCNQLAPQAGERFIDAKDQVVLPGFVNGHTHMYGVLSHGISADARVTEFKSFLGDFWWPCVEDRIDHRLAALTARWACVEMIESGVTSFFDILEAPGAIPGALEAEAAAVRQAGLRGWLSFEASMRQSEENGRLGIRENTEFIQNHCGDDLLKGAMSIHTLFTCPKGFVMKARDEARKIKAKFHMHLSESVMEPNWCKEHYNMRPVEYYHSLNALDHAVIASQLVQVNADEIALMKRSGMSAVSMPLSNCEVGGGIAPVTEMLDAGMRVGLGTDGYINNFFEVMRGAFLIHKAARQSPQAMPAKTVYNMATHMGAMAMGRDDLGRVQKGMLADIITVRVNDLPTPVNEKNVYDQLVLFRNPGDVVNVFVNGRQLKHEGRLTTLNKEAVRAELCEACGRFWAEG